MLLVKKSGWVAHCSVNNTKTYHLVLYIKKIPTQNLLKYFKSLEIITELPYTYTSVIH
jgi:hypothetical protein